MGPGWGEERWDLGEETIQMGPGWGDQMNVMSCWTIVEHVYGVITLIVNSSFHKLFNCTTFYPSRASSGTKKERKKKHVQQLPCIQTK